MRVNEKFEVGSEVLTLTNGFMGEKHVCRIAASTGADDIEAGYCFVEHPDTLMDKDGSKGLLSEVYAKIWDLEDVPEGMVFGDVVNVKAIDPFEYYGV